MFLKKKHNFFDKKMVVCAIFTLMIFLLILFFSFNRAPNIVGHWKINPNAMPGFGISLNIDRHSIDASGDMVNYPGFMKFNYEIINDTEMVLFYDWTFEEWPWTIPYADKIPIKYELSDDKKTLTLIWNGTDFIFLDNTNNLEIFPKSGTAMTDGSITFQKVE